MISSQHTLNEEDVECAICLDKWLEKDSRVLACQHIFCLKCLRQFEDNGANISCSICRTETPIPSGGVEKLPEKLIKNSSKKVENNTRLCLKHERDAIQPYIYCKCCETSNLCEICIENDHLNDNCEILLEKSLNEIKQSIEEYKDNEKLNMQKLMDEIRELEEDCYKKITERCGEIRGKIKEFYQRKYTDYDYLKSREDILTKQNDLTNRLKELEKEKLNIHKTVNISIEYEFNVNMLEDSELKKKKLVCLRQFKIQNSFLYFNERGYYSTKNVHKNMSIIYKTFEDGKDNNEILVQGFKQRFMTDRYFFGIAQNDGRLYVSPTNSLDKLQCLRVNECYLTYRSIWAVGEDLFSQSYIIAENMVGDLDFFIGEKYKRSFSGNDISKICLLSNGNIIIQKINELLMVDRETNEILKRSEIYGFKNMCNFPQTGLLILLQNKEMYLYDYNFQRVQKMECYPYVLGITNTGCLCIPKGIPVKEAMIYKFE
ncbi:unnamed protein product [Dimorphilus gyrociliatus]|uniref:RING-type domain-containing protein n=1 Tax=Dimorphilus gyrociliatus TaxID=2664684 RepID=A0A7I8VG59_9ANNE|nr:unnamed protein product [Dimorphilus gyrociliatus]